MALQHASPAASPDAARQAAPSAKAAMGFWAFAAIALVVTALRITALAASPIDLHGDEAQYWFWSRTLDWGYFSKPPLVAWAIAGSTTLFGDQEWAVRLAAPLAHALGAGALYALGRTMFGQAAGFWAGLGWLVMPGVWLSASVMSTDALLLPLWSLALLASYRLIVTGAWLWAITLGAALGLGFLAKYAMSYFVIGLGLAALWSPAARTALLTWRGAAAGAIALAILAPNLAWNAAHDFATLSHTAANANLGGELFNPEELAAFIVDQFGVMGPFAFAALLALLSAALLRPGRLTEESRFLLAFILPPLAAIAVQALASRAHGNWAAAAYPAAIVFVSGALAMGGRTWALAANTALHAGVGLAFLAATMAPGFADAIGLGSAFKRARAWEETAALLRAQVEAHPGVEAVLVDDRLAFNDLAYYWRDWDGGPRLAMWRLYAEPHNHAEAVAALAPSPTIRVLAVSFVPSYEPFLIGDFRTVGAPAAFEAALAPGVSRRFAVRLAEGFAPAPRDAAFLARLEARHGPALQDPAPGS